MQWPVKTEYLVNVRYVIIISIPSRPSWNRKPIRNQGCSLSLVSQVVSVISKSLLSSLSLSLLLFILISFLCLRILYAVPKFTAQTPRLLA